MKKMSVKLTVVKNKNSLKIARYATPDDPISKRMTCVDTEFFRVIHDFAASVEDLLNEQWESTRDEFLNLELNETPLKPQGNIVSGYHAQFLKFYEELQDQLFKSRLQVVFDTPDDAKSMGKEILKPH